MSRQQIQACGGKGAALIRLRDAGFRVPEFEILPVSFFSGIDPADPRLHAIIEDRLSGRFGERLRPLLGGPLAVRSSAVAEDGGSHSFAGQFLTILNVAADDLPAAVASVWRSAGSADAYAHSAGIGKAGGMAVIIQQMVAADAAGVAFSANPLTGIDEVVVNVVEGLGDKLVDGSKNADSCIIRAGEIQSCRTYQAAAILNDEQLLKVARLAKQAQDHFGGPQDIEFAFEDDQLFLLQSRPITTLPREITVWDNSNIVESYPGLTLPLTYTFIQKMYESVYRQFTALLGVSQKKIAGHSTAFSNMLGLLNGRVYYNLNSWYEALSLLPGYSLNAAFMERMMGVKEKPDIRIPEESGSRLRGWAEVTKALRGILKNLRTARKQARDFEASFNRVYAPFAASALETASLPELWERYSRFEMLMLREWKAPLVNDFFAMIYFGLLQQQCAKLVPGDPSLHNRLLAGSEAVLTTEPMKELPRMVAAIRQDEGLYHVARNGTPQDLLHALRERPHSEAAKHVENYLARWGERSLAELKLETITYRESPEMLTALLQSYLLAEPPIGAAGTGKNTDRDNAEAAVMERLRGHWLQRRIFRHVLSNARYFVAQRENLRYYRTRGFGMVRRMMLAMGARLAETGAIEVPRDVFWLELTELQALAGGSAREPYAAAIRDRKARYADFDANPLPQRLQSYGLPQGIIGKTAPATARSTGDSLQGLPCSTGVVRAPVRLVSYADELRSLDGAILATYATDPGFVVLFASASGILTERGSLLSHAAIVSREMRLPCIVGIDGLMQALRDGDIVEMDGSTGQVRIIAGEGGTTTPDLSSPG